MTMEDCLLEEEDGMSSDEELRIWDSKITQRILMENCPSKVEEVLEFALKEYTRILKKYGADLKIKKVVKDKMLDHVKIFHISFATTSMRTSKVSSYLDIMQSVLVILCNLELDIARQIKVTDPAEYNKQIIEITERLIYMLSIFLLSDNLSICHVLLKLNPKFDSRQWKDVMRVVYRHYLMIEPLSDKSVDNYCRNYLLFENFKAIINKKNHSRTDALLHSRFGMTTDFVRRNRRINKIIHPLANTLIDMVDALGEHKPSSVSSYFKYIENKKKEEDTPLSIYVGSDSEDDDIEILPNFSNPDSGSGKVPDDNVVILVDDDDIKVEDDCITPRNNRVICLDDDSDCEVTIPSEERSVRKKRLNLESSNLTTSFLDLITVPNATISSLESPPYSIETERSPASDDQLQTAPEANFYENDLDIVQQVEEMHCSPCSAEHTEQFLKSCTPTGKEIESTIRSETVAENEIELLNEDNLEVEAAQTGKSDYQVTNEEDSLATNENDPQATNCNKEETGNVSANDVAMVETEIETSTTHLDVNKECCSIVIENELLVQHRNLDTTLSVLSRDNESNIIFSDTCEIDSDVDHCTKKDTVTIEKSLPNGSFNLMHGLITPPKSDRISDDVVTGNDSKNVYVPNLMRIDSICYNGFENIPLITDTSSDEHAADLNSEDDHIEDKRNEESASCESYESSESLEELPMNTEGNLMLHESLNISDLNVNHYSASADDSLIVNATDGLELNEDVDTGHDATSTPIENCCGITSSKQCSLDSSLTSTDYMSTSNSSSVDDKFEEHSDNCSDVIENTRTCNILTSSSNDNIETVVNHQSNSTHCIRANGNLTTMSKPKSTDKIIFTSSEKLSAPLSVFSQFEQTLQSELVEKACSGPIEPMSMYLNSVDHSSNSNDSIINTFSYPSPTNQLISGDSPISPPYEQIHAQDYQNHCDHLINNFTSADESVTNKIEQHKIGQTVAPIIIDRKRRLVENSSRETKTPAAKKVRFDVTQMVGDEILSEAEESMNEYKIHMNDMKLVYLQPQVPIRIESINELKQKEEQLRIRSMLNNSVDRSNGTTCIVKRIDFKHNSALGSPPEIRHKVSNLINKQIEMPRVDNIPSGYVPSLNGYSSVHGLQRNNSMEQKQNFNSHHQNQNSTFNDLCPSEILNLSVSSKVNDLDSPESEFSRSPKLLQNTDQIVQRCLIDNLDNNVEPDVNIHNNITLLSNNSNFYATPDHLTLPKSLPTTKSETSKPCNHTDSSYDKYKDDDLEELLRKTELDKLGDEISLPLKKRRRVPQVQETVAFKEEISYPATPMMSIAEIESLDQNCNKGNRSFKTAAERKEMPPIPVVYNANSSEPTPIITDQFNINNHTYNNPTINYHMNQVPFSNLSFLKMACTPYYPFSSFVLPFNNVTVYDHNLNQDYATVKKEEEHQKATKTAKKQKKKRHTKTKEFFQQFVPTKN